MTDVPRKPAPVASPETAEYWAGAKRHELLIQRCSSCGHHQFYPRVLCTTCSGRMLTWVQASGRGTIRSYTVVRRPVSEAYAPDVPYVVALVALAEGPTMMSRIVGIDPEIVRIGRAVEVTFQNWTAEVSVPVFKPAD
ncbi:MAG: Zn-ribbon domain-containing OB-fold protein [Pseudomonadota bacterium]